MRRMYGEQRQSQIVQNEIHRFNEIYDQGRSLKKYRNEDVEELSEFHENTLDLNIVDSFNQTNNITEKTLATALADNQTLTTKSSELYYHPNLIVNTDNESGGDEASSSSEQLEYTATSPPSTETTAAMDIDDSEDADQNGTPPPEVKGYNACPITQEVVAPYWANNTRGETLALLNVYPFEQYIHWEKCDAEGQQMFCREGCKCEQQYRLHRLLAFDPKNECRGIFADWFRFPGCCVCICYDTAPPLVTERINTRKARL